MILKQFVSFLKKKYINVLTKKNITEYYQYIAILLEDRPILKIIVRSMVLQEIYTNINVIV